MSPSDPMPAILRDSLPDGRPLPGFTSVTLSLSGREVARCLLQCHAGLGFVSSLEVDEACRRRGLGSRLARAAEAEAETQGCTGHCVGVPVTGSASAFWSSLGYEDAGNDLRATYAGCPPHRVWVLREQR